MSDSTNGMYQETGAGKRSDSFYIALLAAYAIGLHGVERFIPSPIPWLRFGFANIITLATILLFGFRAGMTVTLIRVIVGSFITGTFLGPAFILSLSAGVASTVVMWAASVAFGRLFSPVGISLMGALTHNITQLLLAYLFFVRRIEAIVYITPIIILLGTLTGFINGLVTSLIVSRFKESAMTRNK